MQKKKFLIIDKEQRVKIAGKYPYAIERIIEEIELKGHEYDFAYNSEIAIDLSKDSVQILAGGKSLVQYSNIILRGFALHNPREYELYQHIANHVKFHNKSGNVPRTKLLNQHALFTLPYYNKIAFGIFCLQNELPYFNSYYSPTGDYRKNRGNISYPLIVKEYSGVNDLRVIDGEKKVKKNVYLVKNEADWDQEYLEDKDLSSFFIQEYSDRGEDYRIFVAKGKVVGGWKRIATTGFMTVSKGEYEVYNEPCREIREIAEKFAGLIKADFIAVDFMYNNKGEPCIQEISLHPGFKAYETKIKGNDVNLAKIIVECAE